METVHTEPAERLTYTVEQAAEVLGISRWLAYEAAKSGELPTVRIGRRLLVPKAGLLRRLNAAGVENGEKEIER